MKKISFRSKMMLTFAVMIIASLGAMWLLFRILIDDFSFRKIVNEIEECYREMDSIMEGKTAIQRDERNAITVRIGQQYMVFMYNSETRASYNSSTDNWYMDPILRYTGYSNSDSVSEIVRTERYAVYKNIDETTNLMSLDLYGKLSNGFTVLIRASYMQMESDNRYITDRLLLVGVAVLIVSVVVAFLVSRTVTKPIRQMSEVAERMAGLDFDARCTEHGGDEIGVLAGSLNRLSERLQETIGELKNANSELQRDLDYRTQLDEMRSDFIANVSHELKTPIALIQGYAEGLAENVSDDAESRDFYCGVISDEAGKMNRMVQKLMTLTQLEFGGNQVEYERFDIVSLINGVLNSTEVLRTQKEITLHWHETDPVYVWADEYMIEEVVTNYISNAIHYASKQKEIAVSLSDTEGSIRVSVYNTGEPIPEDEIDKIWTKFYKVDKARSREYGGSGIGLSIVKAVMDRHHRRFGVENHENGVEFWFELEPAEEERRNETHDSNH